MKNNYNIIGRSNSIFADDLLHYDTHINKIVSNSRFLLVGGAGTIGQAVVNEIFSRNPTALHVVDISENNLVELVRKIRSTLGYIKGEFLALPIDAGSEIFNSFVESQPNYDYIINLSALKHVRSEKDPFSLMRMIEVNILNAQKLAQLATRNSSKKYFSVSTDKAANPINLMGATKRIMEMFLAAESKNVNTSMARFANVAFSDGSLLHGFKQRLIYGEPLAAPTDIYRYFISQEESGQLCLLSTILGSNLEIFFPSPKAELKLIPFSDICVNFIKSEGYDPYICESEEEARAKAKSLISKGSWPIFLFQSDTTGEKESEEFFTSQESINFNKFKKIGIIQHSDIIDDEALLHFKNYYYYLQKNKGAITKANIVNMIENLLPDLNYQDKFKYLDSKM
jgi:FlaA1/EpsC-like NDP-sugar epimerase